MEGVPLMDATTKLWLAIVAVGALNYLSRLSFIAAFGRRSMPAWLARPLKFVPAAMLTALILPMVVGAPAASAGLPAFDPRVVAAALAAGVAFFTRSTLKTLGAGMLALWLLQGIVRNAG
jgi:branched-subunit amino acid transport protein